MRQQPNTLDQRAPAGNLYDKYNTANPLAKALFSGFLNALFDLLDEPVARLRNRPESKNRPMIHEVGCGEGNLAAILKRRYDVSIIASDYDDAIIHKARRINAGDGVSFRARSVYNCSKGEDDAGIIVCCEVLEHLDNPARALTVIHSLEPDCVIFSVPREPLWRVMNLARGKYVSALGNTPGHINHWNRSRFLKLISAQFVTLAVRSPVPWSVALCKPR